MKLLIILVLLAGCTATGRSIDVKCGECKDLEINSRSDKIEASR